MYAIRSYYELEGADNQHPHGYADPDSDKHQAMVECIRCRLKLTTLRYQRLEDLVSSIGLPWENAAAWERISPFNDVAKITTPTLWMGGSDDWNVPILNSEQIVITSYSIHYTKLYDECPETRYLKVAVLQVRG